MKSGDLSASLDVLGYEYEEACAKLQGVRYGVIVTGVPARTSGEGEAVESAGVPLGDERPGETRLRLRVIRQRVVGDLVELTCAPECSDRFGARVPVASPKEGS
ncbi:MAG: hypothetical protein HYY08_03120 [Firmicutes bacterium]|nr:hypothetical protein [Bacillota bacterium]